MVTYTPITELLCALDHPKQGDAMARTWQPTCGVAPRLLSCPHLEQAVSGVAPQHGAVVEVHEGAEGSHHEGLPLPHWDVHVGVELLGGDLWA